MQEVTETEKEATMSQQKIAGFLLLFCPQPTESGGSNRRRRSWIISRPRKPGLPFQLHKRDGQNKICDNLSGLLG